MHRLPHGSAVAAIRRAVPHRPWANHLRSAMVMGLVASAGMAWGQALTVPAGSTLPEAGPHYYDPGTVDGSYTITAGMIEIANLTVGASGSLMSNAGSTSMLYDNVSNLGTVTNQGMQSVMYSNVSVLTFANSGTWTNQGTFNVAASAKSSAPYDPVVNTGTMINSGGFSSYISGAGSSSIHNSGIFTALPSASSTPSSVDFGQPADNAFVNGPAGGAPGTLLIQVTDGTGTLTGGVLNNAGSIVQLDPAAGLVQRFRISPSSPTTGANIVFTGAGEVQKTSTGISAIEMDMPYTGPTTVKAGTLLVNNGGGLGSIVSTATVASGATLGGDGKAGPVIAQSGSTLAPGNSLPSSVSGSSLGTLTAVGNMQLDAGSISVFELSTPTAATPTASTPVTPGTGDLVEITGDLAMNGTIKPTPSPTMAEGAYKIFTFTGSLTNGATLDDSLLTPLGLFTTIDTSVPNEGWLVIKKIPPTAPAPQTITFTSTPPASATAGGTYNAAATATSGLPVTLTSTTPTLCTVDANGVVTLLAAGTCTLAADQAGDASWLPAPQVLQSFTVGAVVVPPPPPPPPAAAAQPVPTLHPAALALLGLLAAALGGRALRRRNG